MLGMSSPYISSVDLRVRGKVLRRLRERFGNLARDILRGRSPTLVIRKRTLANTVFDRELGHLRIGEATLRRSFLNVGESKKFMQTVLMASIIYEALTNNEFPTIRDLYYRGKHTITYRDLTTGRLRHEETWREQKESDSVIRDIEVLIDMLREDMLILSKEKGKVVGKMSIKSGDDEIDLSKMGHGAYSIEPTPDLIEFKDVNAEFALVIEKDAVFQQLHRAGFWRKYKALLITSAGQPDRATRRFVRRLNEELNLPIYILTDSIPADEVVVIRDGLTGKVMIGPIEELIGNYFTPGKNRERITPPIEVPSWNPQTGKIEWTPIGYAYRHRVKDEILEIETKGRGTIKVTKAHSLFVFRNGKIQVIPAKGIKPGDHILVAEKLPRPSNVSYGSIIFRTQHGKPIPLNKEIASHIGLVTADGSSNHGRYIKISLNPDEVELIQSTKDLITEVLGLHATIYRRKDRKEVQVIYSSRPIVSKLKRMQALLKSRTKRVPTEIINSSPSIQLSYFKGLVDGDGHIDEYGDIIYSTRSEVLSKQVTCLLLMNGINPTIVNNKEDIIVRIAKNKFRTPPDIYYYLSGSKESKRSALPNEPTYGAPISKQLRKLLVREMNKGRISFKPTQRTISKQKLLMLQRIIGSLPDDYSLLANGDITLVKVKSIKEVTYEGYVYDFAVPGTNSFIGSYGIILHNSDPYGWYIYSVFKVGSITLSYESERLATPGARFLGVFTSDIFGSRRLGKRPYLSEAERRNYIIRATDMDKRRARQLRAYKWFQSRRWVSEINMFLRREAKLEIEALTSKGLKFLMDKYIPEKIEVGDWVD